MRSRAGCGRRCSCLVTGSPAVYVVEVGSCITAGALAWRRPQHWPLAALLALGLAADVALEVTALPFGARLVAGACYPWAALAVVRWVLKDSPRDARPADLTGRTRRPHGLFILLAFALYVSALLALGLRGPALAHAYAAAQTGVAVALGWTVWRWREDEGPGAGGSVEPSSATVAPLAQSVSRCSSVAALGWVRALPTTRLVAGDHRLAEHPTAPRPLSATAACAVVVAATEIANVPAYLGLPEWLTGRAVYALCYIVLITIQIGGLAACSPPSRQVTSHGRPS